MKKFPTFAKFLVSVLIAASTLWGWSGCKPKGQDAQLNSLDNFAAGQGLRSNVCSGERSSESSTPVRTALGRARGVRDDLRAPLTAALTAVPEPVLTWFNSLGGRVRLSSDADTLCRGSVHQTISDDSGRRGELYGCFVYLSETETRKRELEIILLSNKQAVEGTLVLEFGYLYAQRLSRQTLHEVAGGPPRVSNLESDPPLIAGKKRRLTNAFLMDVVSSPFFPMSNLRNLIGTNGERAIRSNLARGAADALEGLDFRQGDEPELSRDERERRLNQAKDFIFGEAFDSYYCNAVAESPTAELKELGENRGSLDQLRDLLKRSPNTRVNMAVLFPRSYQAFTDIHLSLFGQKRRQGSQLALDGEVCMAPGPTTAQTDGLPALTPDGVTPPVVATLNPSGDQPGDLGDPATPGAVSTYGVPPPVDMFADASAGSGGVPPMPELASFEPADLSAASSSNLAGTESLAGNSTTLIASADTGGAFSGTDPPVLSETRTGREPAADTSQFALAGFGCLSKLDDVLRKTGSTLSDVDRLEVDKMVRAGADTATITGFLKGKLSNGMDAAEVATSLLPGRGAHTGGASILRAAPAGGPQVGGATSILNKFSFNKSKVAEAAAVADGAVDPALEAAKRTITGRLTETAKGSLSAAEVQKITDTAVADLKAASGTREDIYKVFETAGFKVDDAMKRQIDGQLLHYRATDCLANTCSAAGTGLKGGDPTNWMTHGLPHVSDVVAIQAKSQDEYVQMFMSMGRTKEQAQASYRASLAATLMHDTAMTGAHKFNPVDGRLAHAEVGALEAFGETSRLTSGVAIPGVSNPVTEQVMVSMISQYHSKSASGSFENLGEVSKTLKTKLSERGVEVADAEAQRLAGIVADGSYMIGASDVMRQRGLSAVGDPGAVRPSGDRTFQFGKGVDEVEIFGKDGKSQGVVTSELTYAEMGLKVDRNIKPAAGGTRLDFNLNDVSPGKTLDLSHKGTQSVLKDLLMDHTRGLVKEDAIHIKLNGQDVKWRRMPDADGKMKLVFY